MFAMPVAAGYSGVFSILDETAYNNSLNIVTEYNAPDQTVQSSEHIRGWIDIVGFEDTVRIDNVTYANNTVAPTPIIKRDVWDGLVLFNDNLDSIQITDERFTTIGNITTAEIDIHMLWHRSTLRTRTVCVLGICRTVSWIQKDYYNEYATFSKSVESPVQYPNLEPTAVQITVYNYSFNPHIEISLPIQPAETKTTFTYDNDSITRVNMLGIASTGAVNLSECLYWEDESDLFVTKNTNAILKMNTSEFNPNKLQIVTSSPYESKTITDYTISNVDYNQSEQIKASCVILPLLILIIFGYGIKKCMKLWSEMI